MSLTDLIDCIRMAVVIKEAKLGQQILSMSSGVVAPSVYYSPQHVAQNTHPLDILLLFLDNP